MWAPIALMNRGHCVTAVCANYSSFMSYYFGCNPLTQPNNGKRGHLYPDSSFLSNNYNHSSEAANVIVHWLCPVGKGRLFLVHLPVKASSVFIWHQCVSRAHRAVMFSTWGWVEGEQGVLCGADEEIHRGVYSSVAQRELAPENTGSRPLLACSLLHRQMGQ